MQNYFIRHRVVLEMKALGLKVLAIGVLVMLSSEVIGLYYSWFQFDMYMISEDYGMSQVKTLVVGFLFAQVFIVIGILIVVVGVWILLKAPQKPEPKSSL